LYSTRIQNAKAEFFGGKKKKAPKEAKNQRKRKRERKNKPKEEVNKPKRRGREVFNKE